MGHIETKQANPRLLQRLDEIDADWLTAVLRSAGFDDARVVDFAMTPIGNGNVSDTVRIDLSNVAGSSAPASVVCKFRASSEAAHSHGISSGSYYRQTESYRVIGQSCRTPHLYWLAGGSDNINLVMEDLSRISRAGDQIAGCGPADARAAIIELARLHRAFFPMAATAQPDWSMSMAATADYWNTAIQRALPIIREHVADRLTASELSTVEEGCSIAHRWYSLPVPRGTLTHGDPRVDNILFIDGKAAAAGPQAVLIDWQLTGWRNPMYDVGYFLSGSVSIADRRAHERDLLSHYADVFGPGYPLTTIAEDYRLQVLSGLMTTIASYSLVPLTPKYDALLLALIRRNLAAAADWDSIAAVRIAG